MVKVRKHISVSVKNKAQIAKIINHVIHEYSERTDIQFLDEIDIFVTNNPVRVCKKIFSNVKLKRHGEMRDWICESKPNLSYWEEGKIPVILINANEKIFKKRNWDAVGGLIAHELIHILNKMEGIEDNLEMQMGKAATNIYGILDKHKDYPPFTRDRLYSSLVRVTTTASLIIKDILANTRAMSFGFDEHIFQNYKVVLSDVCLIKYTERDIVKALVEDKKHVLDNVFLAYLGINSTWITFKMFHNKWYKELEKLSNISVPKIIKEKSKPIFLEMMKLRSKERTEETLKIMTLTQEAYYELVKYFIIKIKKRRKKHKKVKKS
jgi:hypothetical protein